MKITKSSVVFIREQRMAGKVYLVAKKPNSLVWNGVGGKFNEGEDARQCIIRETKEETNLDIDNETLKELGEIVVTHVNDNDVTVFHAHVFICDDWDGDIVLNEELEKYRFVHKNTLLEYMEKHYYDKYIHQLLIERKRFELHVTLDYGDDDLVPKKEIIIKEYESIEE